MYAMMRLATERVYLTNQTVNNMCFVMVVIVQVSKHIANLWPRSKPIKFSNGTNKNTKTHTTSI